MRVRVASGLTLTLTCVPETDPDRGGVPVEQLHSDCTVAQMGFVGGEEGWLEQIFPAERPVIPYLRVKEFKIISLKMIVASMLRHQAEVDPHPHPLTLTFTSPSP